MTTTHQARGARAMCATCGHSVRAKDKFCSACGTPIAAAQAVARDAAPAPPTPGDAAPAAAPLTAAAPARPRTRRKTTKAAPTSASLQVAAAPPRALAEQRKVVTIMFADLSGSTPLAEKLDPEDYRGIIGRYFNALARQIQRYEGTIDKYIGDAVMAVFGAPLSHEDDAERAIRAALAMQAAIQRLNDDLEREHGVRLSLRIGINTGEVVAGLLGGDVQRAYTVVGDAVNTAQRFESVAPLNEVLVSESTYRIAAHSFEFETLPPVTLKGKSQPVPAFRVLRPRDEEIPPEASPLVGREAEIERLRAAFTSAMTEGGRSIAIVGEAGVGKSRVVAEFKSGLAHGVERLSARCASYETNTPYALIADLLRGAFRVHEADDEPTTRRALAEGFARYGETLDEGSLRLLLEVMGYGERSTLEGQRKRTVLIGILRTLLGRAAQAAPFVIACEDLHWIDPASAVVLRELSKDVPKWPCLLIVTTRADIPVPWPSETIELAPLGDDDARALIDEILERTADETLTRTILERTGGNPFFIEEVVRSLGSDGTTVEVPPSVQEVLEARIERLPDGPARTLDTAAVVGMTFWYRVLERLLRGDPVSAHVAELEQEAFVVRRAVRPELTYAFRQALIREVAYQTQLLSARRALHGAVAHAIEELFGDRLDEFVDLLAYHYDRSDDDARALDWLVRAGDRALALYANDEALTDYRSALRRAADGTGPLDAPAILERIADVQRRVGDLDGAIASLSDAFARAGVTTGPHAARLLRKRGAILVLKGEREAALQTLDAARTALGPIGRGELASVFVEIGKLHFRDGAYDTARAPLEQAMELAMSAGADDVAAEAAKLLGSVAQNVGDLRSAERYGQQARAAYERTGDVVGVTDVRNNLALLYRRTGRPDEASREFEAVLALRRRTGDVWGLAVAANNLGEVLRTADRPAEAVAQYDEALSIFDRIGEPVYAAAVLMNRGAARTEAGDPTRGLEDLKDARARMEALGGTKFLPSVHRDIAAAELACGLVGRACADAEKALELARRAGARQTEAQAQRILGEIALREGNTAHARELLEQSAATLRELGELTELAKTEAVLATLR